uniref:Uncharacterized protein n=1 Tax=Cacopsylla melanoneura TaxID=428564 RepID=A0A8D8SEY5_9HEMI
MKLKCQQRKIFCHAKIVELTVKNNEKGDIKKSTRIGPYLLILNLTKNRGLGEDLEEKKKLNSKSKGLIQKQNIRKLMELSANTNLKRLEIEHPCRKKPPQLS